MKCKHTLEQAYIIFASAAIGAGTYIMTKGEPLNPDRQISTNIAWGAALFNFSLLVFLTGLECRSQPTNTTTSPGSDGTSSSDLDNTLLDKGHDKPAVRCIQSGVFWDAMKVFRGLPAAIGAYFGVAAMGLESNTLRGGLTAGVGAALMLAYFMSKNCKNPCKKQTNSADEWAATNGQQQGADEEAKVALAAATDTTTAFSPSASQMMG